MILYDYFRSSAAYRVRIALNIKGLDYEQREIHLVKEGGQQHSPSYSKINLQNLVPTLVDDEFSLTQSLAIVEYLEEKCPTPSLLGGNLHQRARIRALADIVCCDIHPLDNLRVLQYLKNKLDVNDDAKMEWYHHWIAKGFLAVERMISENSIGNYCFGDQVTLADVCLIPQVYNAHRFNSDMKPYPNIERVYKNCLALDTFKAADPDTQMAKQQAAAG